MATKVKLTYKQLLDNLLAWNHASQWMIERPVCTLGFPDNKDITLKNIREYFNREKLNDEYVARYNSSAKGGKVLPVAFRGVEIDGIYAFQRAFTARHKTRLAHYRDHTAQKMAYHSKAIIKEKVEFEYLYERYEYKGSK